MRVRGAVQLVLAACGRRPQPTAPRRFARCLDPHARSLRPGSTGNVTDGPPAGVELWVYAETGRRSVSVATSALRGGGACEGLRCELVTAGASSCTWEPRPKAQGSCRVAQSSRMRAASSTLHVPARYWRYSAMVAPWPLVRSDSCSRLSSWRSGVSSSGWKLEIV